MRLFAQAHARLIVQESVFSNAPFKACHAATIINLSNGQLMAAWFGGEYEGAKDVAIWASVRNQHGWSVPQKIAEGLLNGQAYPCWNPVLFANHSGIIFLHYKVGPNPRVWKGFFKTSADNGQTWSAAEALPDSLLGPIKNKPLMLSNGDLLYPSSRESADEKTWTAHFEKSTADHSGWRSYAVPANGFGIIQPTLLQYKDKRIQALFRSRQQVVVQSWSSDEGEHWTEPTALALPNPNSGIDGVSLKDGTQVLVYNPLKAGANWWEGRSVLKVATSTNGIDWKDIYTLEDHLDGEYSYPAIIADAQNHLHIVYTAKRSVIRYVQLKLF